MAEAWENLCNELKRFLKSWDIYAHYDNIGGNSQPVSRTVHFMAKDVDVK